MESLRNCFKRTHSSTLIFRIVVKTAYTKRLKMCLVYLSHLPASYDNAKQRNLTEKSLTNRYYNYYAIFFANNLVKKLFSRVIEKSCVFHVGKEHCPSIDNGRYETKKKFSMWIFCFLIIRSRRYFAARNN